MSPEAIGAVVTGGVSLVGGTAKLMHWAVSQITGALNGIREELGELRADVEKVASKTHELVRGHADHETRIRGLEKPGPTEPVKPPRRGRGR